MNIETAKTYHAFFSRIPNSTFIFPDGTTAAFISGRYTTDNEDRANTLKTEIAAGNPYIFQDAGKLKLTATELDPMAELKARIIAEYEMKKASETDNDRGASIAGKLNIADTGTIASAAAGSSSGAVLTPKSK